MSKKRPPPGLCVHCLGYFDKLTWDHVFPEGWYPDTTPPNIEKWKIPACLPCNAMHAKSEGELLVRLSLCIDPSDHRNAGIIEKAFRAFDRTAGRNERDANARASLKQKLLRQLLEGASIPQQGVYPGFGASQSNEAPQAAIPISANALQRLTEKVVRGLTYIRDNRFIEPPYSVEFYALSENGAQPIVKILERFGEAFDCGPGITVVRAVVPKDETTAVYKIEIWGQLTTYAFVGKQSAEPN